MCIDEKSRRANNSLSKRIPFSAADKEYWTGVFRDCRLIFLSAFCAGLLAHGFIMTNILNNYDNITFTPGGYGAGLTSGRWFLEILGNTIEAVWGNYTLPFFNGCMLIALISVSACILVSVLEIRSRYFAMLTGMLLTVFPTIGCTMFFMYTAPYYALSILLSVAGVYFAKNFERGIIPAAVCFALSLGIYQAYLPFAAALFLLLLLRKGFSSRTISGDELFALAVKYLISLILGVLFYVVTLRFFLTFYHAELTGYQGINQMGFSLEELPAILKSVYEKFFTLSFQTQYGINLTLFVKKAFLFVQVLSGLLFLYLLSQKKQSVSVKILNSIFFLLFPLSINGILLMCSRSYIYTIMVYGIVALFFLPVILLEAAAEQQPVRSIYKVIKGISFALALVLSLTVLNYIWQANGNYMTLYYINRQTENYFVNLTGMIKSAEGYRQNLPLAVIGDNFSDMTFDRYTFNSSTIFDYGGKSRSSDMINSYSRRNWLIHYVGYDQPFVSAEELERLTEKEEVRNMTCYPDDGSIQVIDDVIVIKLEETELE